MFFSIKNELFENTRKRESVAFAILSSLFFALTALVQLSDSPVFKGPYLGQKPPDICLIVIHDGKYFFSKYKREHFRRLLGGRQGYPGTVTG
jgi:hypothetical protein